MRHVFIILYLDRCFWLSKQSPTKLQALNSMHKLLVENIIEMVKKFRLQVLGISPLTFRHHASCILGQAFRYSQENAFYIFNQQIYFIL